MVMHGGSGEHRMFTAALAASLLVHVIVLWSVQDLSTMGDEKSLTPAYNAIEIRLAPARTSPERTEVQRQSRTQSVVKKPVYQMPEAALTESPVETMTSAPEAAAAADQESAAEASESAPQSGGAVGAGIREHYLATVLAQIEAHKFYPLPARRRGLQGRVEVRFMLDARGAISDLDVTGSHSLLVEAARAAVRNAIPLPAAPSMEGFPLAVSYQMIFRLQ